MIANNYLKRKETIFARLQKIQVLTRGFYGTTAV